MTTTATFCAESALNTDTLSEVRDWTLSSPHSTADCWRGGMKKTDCSTQKYIDAFILIIRDTTTNYYIVSHGNFDKPKIAQI